MYRRLGMLVPLMQIKNVLDVGVTSDRKLASSHFFEDLYPYPERITALSNQEASWMQTHYKGLTFVQSSALSMPFVDNCFDLVFSNAVIEHVGSSENQRQFLGECIRVAKQFVFITTPNRYHPMEFHTVLPLIHFLPKKLHRVILNKMGMKFFAREENLNLLSKRDLLGLAQKAGGGGGSGGGYFLSAEHFLGFTSNLLLFVKKGVAFDE
jgi:hypothetical protein